MNILIDGGTGFVGHWIVGTAHKNIKTFAESRKRYESMEWVNHRWDGIIHLAPIAPTKVLEIAKRDKCRVLYASSGIVYHPENEARRQYRADKIRYEQECLDSGVDVVIARLFTFDTHCLCGEMHDKTKAITIIYDAARANLPIKITGDGNTVRSYMHGSLMAHWMWAIFQRGEKRRAYDVGSDTPITILELAKRVIQETMSASTIEVLGGVDPMPYYMPEDTNKTKALFRK
jgi:nucleoside-diphosphate-sugar epimerase